MEAATPVELYNLAIAALNRGEWARAHALAADVDKRVPNHAGVHFVAGVAAIELKQLRGAVAHLHQAVKLNPLRADYHAQLARALASARLFREALAAAEAASALLPSDSMTLDVLGVVFTQVNEHDRAAAAFRAVVELAPRQASYRFNLATALTFAGEFVEAEEEYEACLAIEPKYWKAHLALAQLRRQSAESNHIPRLTNLLDAHADDGGAALYVNLALAKELEDLNEFPKAFEHLSVGKFSHGRTRNYSFERDRLLFQSIAEAVPTPLIGASGDSTREPIFVIGMPRSGTTLVDRILSSHSLVHSCGELQNFGVELKRASGSRTQEMLDRDTVRRARRLDWAKLGQAYLSSTRPATGTVARFVDKLPHNFLYAGFIAQALPNARIVCLRRNPLDTCLSNFRQLFALSSPYYDYSFDLLDTARYYLEFRKLMEHWEQVLPGRILQLDYESLVESQEESTRRLLAFCDLPWEERCMQFEENSAPVATASAVQVRGKLNRDHLERWRHYEDQLAPARAVLREGGLHVG